MKGTWLFEKARLLAIFDDLDKILLMIPLKVGARAPLNRARSGRSSVSRRRAERWRGASPVQSGGAAHHHPDHILALDRREGWSSRHRPRPRRCRCLCLVSSR